MAALPQYEIEATIVDCTYTNPGSEGIRCNSRPECCGGFTDDDTFQCRRFCIYSLRDVDTVTTGYPDGGNVMKSATNTNDECIDFSQNTVLGQDNPLVLPGLKWYLECEYIAIWSIPGNL